MHRWRSRRGPGARAGVKRSTDCAVAHEDPRGLATSLRLRVHVVRGLIPAGVRSAPGKSSTIAEILGVAAQPSGDKSPHHERLSRRRPICLDFPQPNFTRFNAGNGPPGNCTNRPPTLNAPKSTPKNPRRSISAATSTLAYAESPEKNNTRRPPSAAGSPSTRCA